MKADQELRNILRQIDHKGYLAYKQLKGEYHFPEYTLGIDHVQGDPFASPSKVSVRVAGARAGFDQHLYDTAEKKTALEDHLLRGFAGQLRGFSFQAKGSGKSGLMAVSVPGQEILPRTACQIDRRNGDIILRMEIGFPANGRTVNSRELEKMLFDFLPVCVRKSLYMAALDGAKVKKVAELAEDQTYMRQQMEELGLVAFVANGSVLPRESGVSSRPMKGAVAFQSPEELEIEMVLPNRGRMAGMGIRRGITLIVGGGYHGKSTLLKALELGVYNHIAGDGREYVVTDGTAVKLRAEDGRSVKKSDISMFINDLPNGKDTRQFSTEDASGSTSQAANVVEAMEAGSRVFLIDEDTSATNFMIRDELMQRVIHPKAEPITPFINRVQELYSQYGISTILVAGSSGSYFHKAGCIIQMERYLPKDITAFAKEEAAAFPIPEESIAPGGQPSFQRVVKIDHKFKANDRLKMKTLGMDSVMLNHDTIELRYVEQLADTEQLYALGCLVKYAQLQVFDNRKTLAECVDILDRLLEEKGLAAVCGGSFVPSGLAMPRRQEIFACLNRYRALKL